MDSFLRVPVGHWWSLLVQLIYFQFEPDDTQLMRIHDSNENRCELQWHGAFDPPLMRPSQLASSA
jgi:hypothetical protein